MCVCVCVCVYVCSYHVFRTDVCTVHVYTMFTLVISDLTDVFFD